ncbi:unnamed protein product [Pseudo-nitzschia multistriata]|uniref:Uncharacterized protein n=1 Tax=Pseudo-nitzschia multistriata TaxID=183589 RepID=A0A448Z4D4_9STRA|nr:unnamed protein product [Pseudo-nitzschia multistriata]
MDSTEEMAPVTETEVTCDYLIVGAGTACLSFVDTLLDLRNDITFVIVDRNSDPGGHWTKAYPFVRLHQPSCSYGVRSLPLGKLDKNGKEVYDTDERATAKEICEYYEKVVKNLVATGRVRTYFNSNYEGEATDTDGSISKIHSDPASKVTHIIRNQNGVLIHVKCTKLVRSESNVIVPSMRTGVPFPVDKSVVNTIPLNELPKYIGKTQQKYLVIGAGKSGIDALIYLLEDAKVDPDQITWIVSQSAWYFMRDGIALTPKPGKSFWKNATKVFFEPLGAAKSADEAFLLMEKAGSLGRVHPDDGHFPRVFRGANMTYTDLANLRRIKNVLKNMGRVTSITSNEIIFQNGAHSVPFSPIDTLVVDCMTEDTYGYFSFEEDFQFFNPHKIRLGPAVAIFNPSHTSTMIAFLEAEFSDSAAGDAVKNSFCCFPRGRELKKNSTQQLLMLYFYYESKTNLNFGKYKPYSRFVLGDRTDMFQPDHHGGLLGLLWAFFGPTKLHKKTETFVERMENGSLEDFPIGTLTGANEVDPEKFKAVKRKIPKVASSKSTTANAKKSIDNGDLPKKKKGLGSLFCCRTADGIQTNMHYLFL